MAGENVKQPAHYKDKSGMDLYEKWYHEYPFNEFKTGMQMIAERYMKRDKVNRVEDISKAIYTLERLKDYEKRETTKLFEGVENDSTDT